MRPEPDGPARDGGETADVTAVVLTVGEPSTARAVASVERQAAGRVVVVRDVSPFHRALNQGASRVRTPFFVQVDADMVIDATALAALRGVAADGVGVVLGFLRDPLLGRIGAVKLFRTACFAEEQLPDSISPDTDFYAAVQRRGWRSAYALRPATAHTFGAHDPDYAPLYTFRKFVLLGARYRYREAGASLRTLCRTLRDSAHPAAPMALVATAQGIFLDERRDGLVPFAPTPDFDRLAAFLAAAGDGGEVAEPLRAIAGLDVGAAWERGYRTGLALQRAGAARDGLATLRHLVDAGDAIAWTAMVGVCRGLLADAVDEDRLARDLAVLRALLPRPYRLA